MKLMNMEGSYICDMPLDNIYNIQIQGNLNLAKK
jgi:hypothetical protein